MAGADLAEEGRRSSGQTVEEEREAETEEEGVGYF